MKYFLFSLLISINITSISFAHTSPDKRGRFPEAGVWIGTLGAQEILVCFEQPENSSIPNRSGYFYLEHSKPITLRQTDDEQRVWEELIENKVTGVWQIQKITERELDANWHAPNSEKVVAIHLQRFEDLSGSQGDCLSESGVHNPNRNRKIYASSVSQGSIQKISGKKYRISSIEGMNVSTLELLENIPGRQSINFRLQNQLRTDAHSYLLCRNPNDDDDEAEKTNPLNNDSTATVSLAFWNERWISLEATNYGDCGGAHPYSNFLYSTWDTQNGQKVNLWKWFKRSRSEETDRKYDAYYFNYLAPRNLNSLIVKKALKARRALNGSNTAEGDDCLADLRENTTYQLRLSKKGIVFAHDFSFVSQACNDRIELSFSDLIPYLSKEGREAVRYLMY